MEFAEFNLQEYATMEKKTKADDSTECFVLRIATHKTAEMGPSLIFLNEHEAKALQSYVKYYRTIIANCVNPKPGS